MSRCHICGRHGLMSFTALAGGNVVCFGWEGDKGNGDKCVDLGRTRLGINAIWYRTRERYPWMADKQKRKAA